MIRSIKTVFILSLIIITWGKAHCQDEVCFTLKIYPPVDASITFEMLSVGDKYTHEPEDFVAIWNDGNPILTTIATYGQLQLIFPRISRLNHIAIKYSIHAPGYKVRHGSIYAGIDCEIEENLAIDDGKPEIDCEELYKNTDLYRNKQSLKLMEKAANCGSARACHSLGIYYLNKRKKKKAIHWCAKAAQRGDKVSLETFNSLTNE